MCVRTFTVTVHVCGRTQHVSQITPRVMRTVSAVSLGCSGLVQSCKRGWPHACKHSVAILALTTIWLYTHPHKLRAAHPTRLSQSWRLNMLQLQGPLPYDAFTCLHAQTDSPAHSSSDMCAMASVDDSDIMNAAFIFKLRSGGRFCHRRDANTEHFINVAEYMFSAPVTHKPRSCSCSFTEKCGPYSLRICWRRMTS